MTTIEKEMTVQDECIKKHDGRRLVIAGPGTGKTYTIAEKIKDIINNGGNPESILCLTFSETAAKEMKNKVGENFDIDVFTFHGFCMDIMRNHEEEFDMENIRIITDSHKRTLIAECLDDKTLELKGYINEKGKSYQYIKDILDGIDEIKKNRITKEEYIKALTNNNPMWQKRVEELEKIVEQDGDKKVKTHIDDLKKAKEKVNKAEDLLNIYEKYEEKKKNLNFIDFNDMIDMVLERFEDENCSLLETVAEKYKYIIVDEYQDTNKAQNEIVFKLGKYCPNVFAVGDDDQIIFTFQGANLDTMLNYILHFNENKAEKEVDVKCFDKNYRSTMPILKFSEKLAELQDTGYIKFLASKEKNQNKRNEILAIPSTPNRLHSKVEIKSKDGTTTKIEKKLETAEGSKVYGINNPVLLTTYSSPEQERDAIVSKIIEIKKDIDEYNEKEKKLAEKETREPEYKRLSEIAILTKNNKELKDYEAYLKANGVPVEITGGKNIFEINAVISLITYMQFLVNPEKYSDKFFSYLLMKPFNMVDIRDYRALIKEKPLYPSLIEEVQDLLKRSITEDEFKSEIQKVVDENKTIKSIEESLKDYIDKSYEPNNKEKDYPEHRVILYAKDKLQKFYDTYDTLKEYVANENYKTAILVIGEETGIFHEYFCEDEINKLENMKGIRALIKIADAYFDVNKNDNFIQFVEYLTKMIEGSIELKLDKEEKPLNAVQLSTYHSSKGREFEYVFMPILTKAMWESSSSSYKDSIPLLVKEGTTYEELEDNAALAKYLDCIKILYVGMTRAKHALYLSYANTGNSTDGKLSWFVEQIATDENKIFIDKNGQELEIFKSIDGTDFDNSKDYMTPKPLYDYKKDFCDSLPTKFSASAINTYRNCPKQYFYNYILKLGTSSAPSDDASFGTAMHAAFEFVIQKIMDTKQYPSNEDVYEVFKTALNKLEVEEPDKLKTCAKEKLFSENGYYKKFQELVDIDDIACDSKFESHPELDLTKKGVHTVYAEYPINCTIKLKDFGINIGENKEITFNGYIDKLDQNKDGEFYIYDYKSKDNCSDIAPSDKYFYQMVFYKFVLEHQYEGIKITKASFLLPLEKNNNNEINLIGKFNNTARQDSKNRTNYKKAEDTIFDCIRGIYNLEFDIPKSPNCNYCGYKQFCNAKTV